MTTPPTRQLSFLPESPNPTEEAPADSPQAERRRKGAPIRDLTGQRFGRLVALGDSGERRGAAVVWRVLCDCGNEVAVLGYALTRGKTKSCGCLGVKGTGKGRSATGKRYNHPGRQNIVDGSRAFRHLFVTYRGTAGKRGIDFDLKETEFEFLVKSNCTYCGLAPSQRCKSKGDVFVYNGIDRIDSDGPYSFSNCVASCGPCNMAKGTMTVEEFRAHVRRVYHHWAGPLIPPETEP